MATFTLPAALTSKTVAVNALLSSIAESPVTSAEDNQAVDVSQALLAIDTVNRAVQSEGWFWNREFGMELAPDADGNILLPSNCLAIMRAYPRGSLVPLTERGRKLYDPKAHSYTFTDPCLVDMIVLLDWEEMPEYARGYITMRAAQLFQGQQQNDRVVAQVQEPEVQMSRSTLEQREDEACPQNQISGNAETARRLAGRGLRRRY